MPPKVRVWMDMSHVRRLGAGCPKTPLMKPLIDYHCNNGVDLEISIAEKMVNKKANQERVLSKDSATRKT